MEESMPNWLLQRAYLTPHRKALLFSNQSWTFQEMATKVIELAKTLTYLEIKEHERVAILVKNTPETVWLIHALQQMKVETVFLNHRLTAAELIFQINDSGAHVLLYDNEFAVTVKEITRLSKIKAYEQSHLQAMNKAEFTSKAEFNLNHICSIMYTSGTTGKPKGVLQTYGNHWWSAIGSSLNLGIAANDVWLCTVPIFHISGLSILMRSIIYGMPVYLMDKFNEHEANRLLKSGDITMMSVVSVMLSKMLYLLKDEPYHPNFRCMLLGGGPAPLSLLEQCEKGGIPVFQTYGMTETASQVVTLSPEDSIKKLGSAGKPLFPAQIKIIKKGGEVAPLGEAGEITIKGPNVTVGYLNRPDVNKELFQDGWFATGDVGYLDEDGFLYVLDRRSDLIISGGENIYPAEIEAVLLAHEAVLEAGVIGIDDPKWGQVPIAFVVVNQDVTEKSLLTYCREKLATYKIPNRIIQIQEMPRNGANKLMRRKLHQLL